MPKTYWECLKCQQEIPQEQTYPTVCYRCDDFTTVKRTRHAESLTEKAERIRQSLPQLEDLTDQVMAVIMARKMSR